jgi:hypothetical protein
MDEKFQAQQGMPEQQPNLVIEALSAHFIAKSTEALARLAIYTQKPTGIGDHSNILEECASAASDYDSAQSTLERLNTLFGSKPPLEGS